MLNSHEQQIWGDIERFPRRRGRGACPARAAAVGAHCSAAAGTVPTMTDPPTTYVLVVHSASARPRSSAPTPTRGRPGPSSGPAG